MPTIPPDKVCPDCRGRGSILLLVRTVPCKRCEGRGYLLTSWLELPIAELRISIRARTALKRLGAETVRDVTRISEADLLRDKSMSAPAVEEVKRALAVLGLSLKKT